MGMDCGEAVFLGRVLFLQTGTPNGLATVHGGTGWNVGEGCVLFTSFHLPDIQSKHGTPHHQCWKPKTYSMDCPFPEDLLPILTTKGKHCIVGGLIK